MEQFVNTVKSQVIPLSSVDMLSGMFNIPYAFFYQNTNAVDDFMPSEQLKTAFYLALQMFPILAGHLRQTGGGRFSMVVDKDNLNMPEYLESTSDVHYNDIKSAGFDRRAWPNGVATVGSVIAPDANGIIKTANVHIVRLKDYSGLILFLNIIHCVVDGFAYFAFLNHWAAVCKTMRSGAVEVPKPPVEFTFDRSIIEQNLPTERKQLDATTSSIFARPSLFSKWLAWLSPEMRGSMLRFLVSLTTTETHVFHIVDSTLDTLRSSVSKFVPEGVRLSDNDVLVALVSKTYAQALCSVKEKSGNIVTRALGSVGSAALGLLFGAESHQVTGMACDIRPRICIADKNYVGCPQIFLFVTNPLGELLTPTTAESLASIALNVRRLVENLGARYVRTLIDAMGSAPSSFAKLTAYLMKHPTLLLTSNQTRFRMFKTDFGDGYQEWAAFIKERPGTVIFMPCPPPMNGANISMCVEAPILREILANEFWMSTASQIN
ncbi:transferase family protein [Martensiomyces pterosporus]|nr:transferase family protein [Martensiomyces pterosporus]